MKHILILFIVLCVAGAADAAIIVQESFSYTAGQNLQGQGAAGSGWAGAWSSVEASGDMTIISGGLSYNAGGVIIDGGNTAVQITEPAGSNGSNHETRTLASAVTDSTLYIRFLMRGDTSSWSRDVAAFKLTGLNNTTRKDIAQVGYASGDMAPNIFGGKVYDGRSNNVDVPFTSGPVHLVVVKLWIDPNVAASPTTYNTMDFWLDPNLAGTTGFVGTSIATGNTVLKPGGPGIDGVKISRGALDGLNDKVTFDEYVLGQTWGDVVVPEPATMALMAFGGLALIRRRK